MLSGINKASVESFNFFGCLAYKSDEFSHRRVELFAPKRRKKGFKISCLSGLHPKPRPIHRENIEDIDSLRRMPSIQDRECDESVCHQIERLVFFKRYEDALELFEIVDSGKGCRVSSRTYDSLVNACIGLRSSRGVKSVCNHIIETKFELDQYLRNRILLMHVKCGMMVDARQLFSEMPERNAVSWNTIISGLVDSGAYEEAISLFVLMWKDSLDSGPRAFSTVLRASASVAQLNLGMQLHTCVFKIGIDTDLFVTCALIDMYSKCGNIGDAYNVFAEMPDKNVVGWNTIIAGYALHGYSEEALDLYYEMQNSGVKMDHFTYSIIIRICARLASLEHAKQAHAGLIRNGFVFDIVANTSLVDFYSKWGRMDDAQRVFNKMPTRNIISWNALIGGYGNHGQGNQAIEMFKQMVHEGVPPNHVTFLAVLSACSNSGLSDQGWEIFESMSRVYKVEPRAKHYACMIELLGREGLLDEALALIRGAPFRPTENMWAALLTACRVHKNLELGKFAAEKLFGMEPEKLSNYIVLLNIYISSNRSAEAAIVLETLKRRGLQLFPACSWIEINKQAHKFHFGDKSHAQSEAIYGKLDELREEIKNHGYIQEEKPLLSDVGQHEEQHSRYHSEMLAIGFGLIHTLESSPLQIVQSHRICSNCHAIIKSISKLTKRDIVVRDAGRFHHFKGGICSCGDYW